MGNPSYKEVDKYRSDLYKYGKTLFICPFKITLLILFLITYSYTDLNSGPSPIIVNKNSGEFLAIFTNSIIFF